VRCIAVVALFGCDGERAEPRARLELEALPDLNCLTRRERQPRPARLHAQATVEADLRRAGDRRAWLDSVVQVADCALRQLCGERIWVEEYIIVDHLTFHAGSFPSSLYDAI
jgi:hypothetical protein